MASRVFVYLERTLAIAEPLPPGVVPQPYGLAAPVVESSGTLCAAVPSGEAIWLGFQAVNRSDPAIVRIRVEGPAPLDALTGAPWDEALVESPRNHLVCPPDSALPGIRRTDGYVPFGQDEFEGDDIIDEIAVIAYGDTIEAAVIRFLTAEAFTRVTGVAPEPLDPNSAYMGWRLP